MTRNKPKTRKQRQEQLLWELSGLALLVLALVTVLGLVRFTSGTLLDGWIRIWRRALGWGALAVPLLLGVIGVLLLQGWIKHPSRWPWRKLISGEIAFLSLLTAFHTLAFGSDPWLLADAGGGGGLVGWTLSGVVIAIIGRLPTAVFTVSIAIVAGSWAIGMTQDDVRYLLGQIRKRLGTTTLAPDATPPEPQASAPKSGLFNKQPQPLKIITAADSGPKRTVKRDRRLPPLNLLDQAESPSISESEMRRKVEIIERTLEEFGLPVRVTEVRQGPVVTQFGVKPGFIERTDADGNPIERIGPDGHPWRQKVRVGQISALANDLALALAAPRLRIEAPVPGRSIVGIEVPNDRLSIVHLRPVIESTAFRKKKSPLTVALGRDVSGAPIAANLATMPHLLIAGATGSGKSVAISSMVTCLAFNNPPDQLRLVMIDPKLVEMTRFNGLPHLFGNVEVELDRIIGVLRWVTREMDDRYKLLSEAGSRHLDDYNIKLRRGRKKPLPYIVVFIDELADLMTMAASETEHTITRLAQMARAVGIHLAVATQRPSTDVVTGLIKANFPARISFAVASHTDSRVIIDQVGAEKLLGRGDMLFLNPELGHPVRVQSCFVSDREIENLVNFWRQETSDEQDEPAPWESMLQDEAKSQIPSDPLLEEAIELVREENGASASLLQRRMRIGYPRAASIIDQMEELGVIGPPESGGRVREVLPDSDDDYSATAASALPQ
jgi:S-DNA-T family DNA segregation ATPase FtsK/SpoIIIE